MFDSVAFNVVIGLVFIYLLYSLLATVLSEIIATSVGLRARNLREAVDRMLTDEKEADDKRWYMNALLWLWYLIKRSVDSLRLLKSPNNPVIKAFYNHPEIKYLGSSGVFKNPSSFQAVSFSKTLLSLLLDDAPETKENIDAKLHAAVASAAIKQQAGDTTLHFDEQTGKYILGLWKESYGDIQKFKTKIEGWFDRTMEQATEWYKRKIQVVLLVLGFCIAAFFNVDTFAIVHKLSVDKDAREKLVSMANAYVQNNKTAFDNTSDIKINIKDSADLKAANKKLDTLLQVKRKLEADISNAQGVLGSGGAWLPDKLSVVLKDTSFNLNDKKRFMFWSELHQTPFALLGTPNKKEADGKHYLIEISASKKRSYFWDVFADHFPGFLITAIAISLGAPFWFDLLNKLMKLRTSQKQDTDSTVGKNTQVAINERVG